MVHGSDDGTYTKDSLKECLTIYKDLDYKDFIIARFSEGPGGGRMDDSYWKAWTHADLRLPGVPKDAFVGIVTMPKYEFARPPLQGPKRWGKVSLLP